MAARAASTCIGCVHFLNQLSHAVLSYPSIRVASNQYHICTEHWTLAINSWHLIVLWVFRSWLHIRIRIIYSLVISWINYNKLLLVDRSTLIIIFLIKKKLLDHTYYSNFGRLVIGAPSVLFDSASGFAGVTFQQARSKSRKRWLILYMHGTRRQPLLSVPSSCTWGHCVSRTNALGAKSRGIVFHQATYASFTSFALDLFLQVTRRYFSEKTWQQRCEIRKPEEKATCKFNTMKADWHHRNMKEWSAR